MIIDIQTILIWRLAGVINNKILRMQMFMAD